MRKVLVIGIGAGNPDHLTMQAVRAMAGVDVFFIPDKGAEKGSLRQVREDICARVIPHSAWRSVGFSIPARPKVQDGYRTIVDDWHEAICDSYVRLIETELAEGQCGAFLVWGDPSLYDSTLRILDRVLARGVAVTYDVIPGITSVQALTAAHRIPLNRIGEPVLVTTGRKLGQGTQHDTVVMLDDGQALQRAAADPALRESYIYWGACLGTGQEMLVQGRLCDVAARIEAARQAVRTTNGWVMDVFLLRPRTEGG